MNRYYVDMSLGFPVFYNSLQGVPRPKTAKFISRKTFETYVAAPEKYTFSGAKLVKKKGVK